MLSEKSFFLRLPAWYIFHKPIMVIWQGWDRQDDYSNIEPRLFSQRSKTSILFVKTFWGEIEKVSHWRKREIVVLWVYVMGQPGNGYGWGPGDQVGPWLLSPPPPLTLLRQEKRKKHGFSFPEKLKGHERSPESEKPCYKVNVITLAW